MQVISTCIDGVLILEPKVFGDARGFFLESWNAQTFKQATGVDVTFVQDNHSRSERNVLRGLHYQLQQAQGKLVRVTNGIVFDVVVDLRRSSPTFGQWFGVELSVQNHRQLWLPPGCAHGFLVRSAVADFLYKATDYYAPEYERCIRWNDEQLGVDWGLEEQPILSEKDQRGVAFIDAEVYA